jgi:hypothetical protein
MEFASFKSGHKQFGSQMSVDGRTAEVSQVEYLQAELYKAKMDNKALEQELEKILQVCEFAD